MLKEQQQSEQKRKAGGKRGLSEIKSLIKSDDSDCMITSEGDSPDAKKLNTEISKKTTINCCRTTPRMKMEASSDTLQGTAGGQVKVRRSQRNKR